MRMSCNGCRVLRKGCSDDCTLRPCLQWIKNSDSQGNATLFLAKFYGRAGLMNLISGGPEHLRPAIFRSLLYEACGRIVNPIYGSAGLLWSGSWQLCQAAVEAVLSGGSIVQVSSESDDASNVSPPLKACDIRHVFKVDKSAEAASHELHKLKTRKRSKRSAATLKVIKDELDESGVSEQPVQGGETDSMSVETEEPSLVEKHEERTGGGDLDLELTLGFEPVRKAKKACLVKGGDGINGSGSGTSELQLGL